MDIRKIKKLIELIDETGVAEIEIHEGEESVRICRSSKQSTFVHYPEQVAQQAPGVLNAPAPAPLTQPNNVAQPATPAEQQNVSEGHVIKSPMVGTVYFAPSPDADPFITQGQEIGAGDVVCVIEAMKMFNEIETDISGTVSQIHVENAQPVEFGQPLFTIDINE